MLPQSRYMFPIFSFSSGMRNDGWFRVRHCLPLYAKRNTCFIFVFCFNRFLSTYLSLGVDPNQRVKIFPLLNFISDDRFDTENRFQRVIDDVRVFFPSPSTVSPVLILFQSFGHNIFLSMFETLHRIFFSLSLTVKKNFFFLQIFPFFFFVQIFITLFCSFFFTFSNFSILFLCLWFSFFFRELTIYILWRFLL